MVESLEFFITPTVTSTVCGLMCPAHQNGFIFGWLRASGASGIHFEQQMKRADERTVRNSNWFSSYLVITLLFGDLVASTVRES